MKSDFDLKLFGAAGQMVCSKTCDVLNRLVRDTPSALWPLVIAALQVYAEAYLAVHPEAAEAVAASKGAMTAIQAQRRRCDS